MAVVRPWPHMMRPRSRAIFIGLSIAGPGVSVMRRNPTPSVFRPANSPKSRVMPTLRGAREHTSALLPALRRDGGDAPVIRVAGAEQGSETRQHYCFTLSRDAGDAIARRRSSSVASVVPGPVEATSSPEIQEVSAEPTGPAITNLGHPNLASVDCSG